MYCYVTGNLVCGTARLTGGIPDYLRTSGWLPEMRFVTGFTKNILFQKVAHCQTNNLSVNSAWYRAKIGNLRTDTKCNFCKVATAFTTYVRSENRASQAVRLQVQGNCIKR